MAEWVAPAGADERDVRAIALRKAADDDVRLP